LGLSEKLLINDTFFTGIRDGIDSVENKLRAESPRHNCWILNSSNHFIFSPASNPLKIGRSLLQYRYSGLLSWG